MYRKHSPIVWTALAGAVVLATVLAVPAAASEPAAPSAEQGCPEASREAPVLALDLDVPAPMTPADATAEAIPDPGATEYCEPSYTEWYRDGCCTRVTGTFKFYKERKVTCCQFTGCHSSDTGNTYCSVNDC